MDLLFLQAEESSQARAGPKVDTDLLSKHIFCRQSTRIGKLVPYCGTQIFSFLSNLCRLPDQRESKIRMTALSAISTTNGNLPAFSPTCFARRNVRQISKRCRNCLQGSHSYFTFPLDHQSWTYDTEIYGYSFLIAIFLETICRLSFFNVFYMIIQNLSTEGQNVIDQPCCIDMLWTDFRCPL